MNKYTLKGSIVRAYQITDAWFDGLVLLIPGIVLRPLSRTVQIPGFTNLGVVGDWIIIRPERITLCSNTTFQRLYEKHNA